MTSLILKTHSDAWLLIFKLTNPDLEFSQFPLSVQMNKKSRENKADTRQGKSQLPVTAVLKEVPNIARYVLGRDIGRHIVQQLRKDSQQQETFLQDSPEPDHRVLGAAEDFFHTTHRSPRSGLMGRERRTAERAPVLTTSGSPAARRRQNLPRARPRRQAQRPSPAASITRSGAAASWAICFAPYFKKAGTDQAARRK